MRSIYFFTCFLLLAAATARAQPNPTPATDTAFLEQRVVGELAADGIVLARMNVSLHIEILDGHALVSLIDPTTGRAAASTKVDALPADRDAAVATLTPVVADMVSQMIAARPAATSDRDVLERIERDQRDQRAKEEADRAERARVEQAERDYQAQAIRFHQEIVGFSGYATKTGVVAGSVGHRWVATQGETEIELSPADFYHLVERPDLLARYHHRRKTAGWMIGIGAAVMVGGIAITFIEPVRHTDYTPCNGLTDWQLQTCRDQARDTADEKVYRQKDEIYVAGTMVAVAGVVVGALGYRYLLRPHPISERAARQIAAEHNRKLRQQLGLPVGASPPLSSGVEVQLAPYLAAGGGGLALTGRF